MPSVSKINSKNAPPQPSKGSQTRLAQNHEYAGFGARFNGKFFDLLIVLMMSVFTDFVIKSFGYTHLLVLIINSIILPVAIGCTLGQKIMGLQLVNKSYDKISFLQSLGRFFASLIFLGELLALFTEKNQALADKIANTYVIYTDKPTKTKLILTSLILFALLWGSGLFIGKQIQKTAPTTNGKNLKWRMENIKNEGISIYIPEYLKTSSFKPKSKSNKKSQLLATFEADDKDQSPIRAISIIYAFNSTMKKWDEATYRIFKIDKGTDNLIKQRLKKGVHPDLDPNNTGLGMVYDVSTNILWKSIMKQQLLTGEVEMKEKSIIVLVYFNNSYKDLALDQFLEIIGSLTIPEHLEVFTADKF